MTTLMDKEIITARTAQAFTYVAKQTGREIITYDSPQPQPKDIHSWIPIFFKELQAQIKSQCKKGYSYASISGCIYPALRADLGDVGFQELCKKQDVLSHKLSLLFIELGFECGTEISKHSKFQSLTFTVQW